MAVRRLVAGGVVAAVLAVTGCSGGSGAKVATLGGQDASSSSGDGASSDAKQSFQDAAVAFAKCMREHGVDMPDPTFDADGSGKGSFAIVGGPAAGGSMPDQATMEAANEACQPIMDAAAKDLPKPSPEEQAKMRDQALAFAKCMREHGVDMPDPTFDENGGMTVTASAEAKPSADGGDQKVTGPDPAFLEAAKACQTDGGPGMVVGGAGPGDGGMGFSVRGGDG